MPKDTYNERGNTFMILRNKRYVLCNDSKFRTFDEDLYDNSGTISIDPDQTPYEERRQYV